MTVLHSTDQSESRSYSHPWLAHALFALDVHLRRRARVLEYTAHPGCIFRVDFDPAARDLMLQDGVHVRKGERIGHLHYWNEQVPPVGPGGATIGWGRRFQNSIALSLDELARFLSSRPDLDDVKAVWLDAGTSTQSSVGRVTGIMQRHGFESIPESEPASIAKRIHIFLENILIALFVFAQNASTFRFDILNRVRVPLFLSRQCLMQRLGAAAPGSPQAADPP